MAAPAWRGLGYRSHPRPSQHGDCNMIRLRHLAAASSLSLAFALTMPFSTPVFISPALAQSIVFDPTNYAQNVLTAARELQQTSNKVTARQNQAQRLIN